MVNRPIDQKTTYSRKVRSENRRSAIFRAAMELFAEKGFDHVSVNEITKAANVSIGSFYHHFGSKENILKDINKSSADQFYQLYESLDKKQPVMKRIEIFWEQSTLYSQLDPQFDNSLLLPTYKILYGKYVMNEEFSDIFLETGQALLNVNRKFIDEGVASGEIRDDIDAGSLARLMSNGLSNTCYLWACNNGKTSLSNDLLEYIRLIIQLIRKPGI